MGLGLRGLHRPIDYSEVSCFLFRVSHSHPLAIPSLSMPARTNATPAAGPFDPESDFQFRCSVRKGNIRKNPRGGKLFKFKIKISEGLGVAKAKVLSFLQQTLPSAQMISEDLYFKKSKGAPQSQYGSVLSQRPSVCCFKNDKPRCDAIILSCSDDAKNKSEGSFFRTTDSQYVCSCKPVFGVHKPIKYRYHRVDWMCKKTIRVILHKI